MPPGVLGTRDAARLRANSASTVAAGATEGPMPTARTATRNTADRAAWLHTIATVRRNPLRWADRRTSARRPSSTALHGRAGRDVLRRSVAWRRSAAVLAERVGTRATTTPATTTDAVTRAAARTVRMWWSTWPPAASTPNAA